MSKIITLSYTDFKPVYDKKSSTQSLRVHCVNVRLNKEELEILNKKEEAKPKANGYA